MKSQLQVVENSDRFHLSENGTPVMTDLFNNKEPKSRLQSLASVRAVGYALAEQRFEEGYEVVILPQKKA